MKSVKHSCSDPLNITRVERDVIVICDEGQKWTYANRKYVNEYVAFVRKFAGTVKQDLKTKNPLVMTCIVHDIENILGVLNPALKKEVVWFKKLSTAIKAWVNDRITVHRMLGIKNDNQP